MSTLSSSSYTLLSRAAPLPGKFSPAALQRRKQPAAASVALPWVPCSCRRSRAPLFVCHAQKNTYSIHPGLLSPRLSRAPSPLRSLRGFANSSSSSSAARIHPSGPVRSMAAEQQSAEQFRGQARLPGFAAPRRYDLRLAPDLAACAFAGSVAVDLHVAAPTRFLVLNAAELDVAPGGVGFAPAGSGQVLQPVEVTNVPEDEILIICFNEVLPLGEGTLTIEFQGTLNDKMHGFYRSVYELNGEKKNMAVTQFEPADARRCFPCWDEPAFKAVFKITLEVPSETVALSNMPVTEEKVNGPTKTVYFQESPIMSTYLVAVIVGIFDYVEDFTTDGTRVRVYTQVGKSAQGKFALEVALKTLVLFKE